MEYESEISLLILLGARSWLPTITAVVSAKKWSLLRDGIIHVITIYIIYSWLFPIYSVQLVQLLETEEDSFTD